MFTVIADTADKVYKAKKQPAHKAANTAKGAKKPAAKLKATVAEKPASKTSKAKGKASAEKAPEPSGGKGKACNCKWYISETVRTKVYAAIPDILQKNQVCLYGKCACVLQQSKTKQRHAQWCSRGQSCELYLWSSHGAHVALI